MADKKSGKRSKVKAIRQPPLTIPLSFEDAIGGLLAVKPEQKNPAKRKAVPKKTPGNKQPD